jgi:DNA helicase-2/ATP-dependent DNA helicase PcrA
VSLSLGDARMRTALVERLASTVRTLIVDEVFDGNQLDLAVVELAVAAGAHVTIIGDPWQALYRFRGARPDLVSSLVESWAMTTLPLDLLSLEVCGAG